MSDDIDEIEDFAEGETDDVSTGRGADPASQTSEYFDRDISTKFEMFSYRNAAAILASNFPSEFGSLIAGLKSFEISREMIRIPGGSKGPIAKYVDTLFPETAGWQEARISADLHVKLLHAKQKNVILNQYTKEGFLDGHRIDFLNGRVALERFPSRLNREGFPGALFSDSSYLPVRRSAGDGSSLVVGFARAGAGGG